MSDAAHPIQSSKRLVFASRGPERVGGLNKPCLHFKAICQSSLMQIRLVRHRICETCQPIDIIRKRNLKELAIKVCFAFLPVFINRH